MTKLKLKGNSKSFKKTASSINRRELNTAMSEMTSCNSGINPIKGYISLPSFNSTTGQKEDFYGLYISDGELTVDTVTNVKEQINSFCTGGGSSGPQALRLTFDSIENANLLVGDASNVNDWNTFFDLPNLGTAFTSVIIVGNEVQLFGGANIKVKPALMYDYNNNTFLISVIDGANCITSVGGDAFSYCDGLTTVDLPVCTIVYGYEDSPQNDYGGFGVCLNLVNINIPLVEIVGIYAFSECTALTTFNAQNLISVGDYCFSFCTALTTINIPSCVDLGITVGINSVFDSIIGNTITLTVPSALMTADAGNPDGDIAYLQANNTVTVVTV